MINLLASLKIKKLKKKLNSYSTQLCLILGYALLELLTVKRF